MWWVLRVLVGVIIVLISQGTVSATSGDGVDWSNYTVQSKINQPLARELYHLCSGEVRTVRIAYDPEPRRVCSYGMDGGVRFVQFHRNGSVLSALAYPTDTKFYILRDLCTQNAGDCVYSQQTDSLLQRRQLGWYDSELVIARNFAKNATRVFDPLTNSYYYQHNATFNAIDMGRTQAKLFGYATMSQNGRWAAAEAVGLGVLRIDMETLEHRRVGFTHSPDPVYRFSVTDDGLAIAMSSERGSPAVININDTCGDKLSDFSTGSFPGYVLACKRDDIAMSPSFENYRFTTSPYFVDTKHLLLTVYTSQSAWEVIITPKVVSSTPKLDYIALGDSFSSGEGEIADEYYLSKTNTRPHTCHVSSRSYPYVIDQVPFLSVNVDSNKRLNAACSGAVMKDIVGVAGYKGQGSRLENVSATEYQALWVSALGNNNQGIIPQIDFVKKHTPKLVSVGIGGNDVGFIGKLKSCLALDTCAWAKPGESRGAVAAEIDALYEKYTSLLDKIKQVSPDSKILLIGYPKIISEDQDAKCDVLIGSMLNHDERIFITRSIERINDVIKKVSADNAVDYVSIQEAYEGSKLCDGSGNPSMNGVRFGDDYGPNVNLRVIGAESFHPTPSGHKLAALAIGNYLQGGSGSVQFRGTGNAYANEEYWMEGSNEPSSRRFILLDEENAKTNTNSSTNHYTVNVSENIFESNSKVYIKTQGSELETEVMADSSGGVYIDGLLPDISQSPATSLFIRGRSVSGEDIIAYTFIDTPFFLPEVTEPNGILWNPILNNPTLNMLNNQPTNSSHEDVPGTSVLGASTGSFASVPVLGVQNNTPTPEPDQSASANHNDDTGRWVFTASVVASALLIGLVLVLLRQRSS